MVAAENASIDMAGLTGDVTVTVIADNVAIEGAAEGTVVAVAEGVEGTTVNDVAVTAGDDYVVPAEEADEPTPAPDPNPDPTPGPDDPEESDDPEADDPETDKPEADDPEESDDPEAEEEEEFGPTEGEGGAGDTGSEEVTQ